MNLRKLLPFKSRAGTGRAGTTAVPTSAELKAIRQAAMAGDRPVLQRARQRFADSRDVLRYAGICHYRRKEFAEATLALEAALTAAPRDSEAALFLMRAHYAAGAFDKCEQTASALLELAPDNIEGLRTLGRIHNRRRAWTESASTWRRLAAAAPEDAEAPLQVARASEHLNDHAEALLHADRALLTNPENGEAARIKISALIALGTIDLQPIVDVIGTFYRFDPPRALTVVRRLAASADPRTTASMIERLSNAFPGDPALDLLAATLEGGWRARLARSTDAVSVASYREGLEVLARIVPKTIPTTEGPLAAVDLPTRPSAARQLIDNVGSSVKRVVARSKNAAKMAIEASTGGLSRREVEVLQKAQELVAQDRLGELGDLLPSLHDIARRDTRQIPTVAMLASRAGDSAKAIDLWSTLHDERPADDEAAVQLARALLREGRSKEAESAIATAVERDQPSSEALRIALKIQLIEGRIEDAVATAQPFISYDPQQARQWFSGQAEEWALLVCALAFSRSLSSDREDVLDAAERLSLDCLGRGFEREIRGDMVAAFVAYHAAASLRPDDSDATLSERRVRQACHATLRDNTVAVQSLLPTVSAKIFALTIG